jgi:hypothetical protein
VIGSIRLWLYPFEFIGNPLRNSQIIFLTVSGIVIYAVKGRYICFKSLHDFPLAWGIEEMII